MHLQPNMFAAVSALAWIAMFLAKGRGRIYAGNCAGIVYHLALAPVVAALPAPEWVRMAGFVWIFSDTALDVASINGMSSENVWALRMGVHVSAAVWIVGSSLNLPITMLLVGSLLGVSLGVHAVIAPFVSEKVLFLTAFPLMIAWLGLITFTFVP